MPGENMNADVEKMSDEQREEYRRAQVDADMEAYPPTMTDQEESDAQEKADYEDHCAAEQNALWWKGQG